MRSVKLRDLLLQRTIRDDQRMNSNHHVSTTLGDEMAEEGKVIVISDEMESGENKETRLEK